MARATRSTTNLEKSELPLLPRTSSKKRKRLNNADNDDQPLPKSPRTDGPADIHNLQSVADSHILDFDAVRILDVLEVTDSQGLLDRVFPLPSHVPTQGLFSLRALLKQPNQHPLWVLRSAVQNLLPLSSSHPRSRPSDTAVQQQHFCSVALSLLDQASRNLVRVPFTRESILCLDPDLASASSPDGAESPSAAIKSQPASSPKPIFRKYALVQHLQSGDYWSSLNANIHNSSKQLKDLSLGNAELVAVFPTPSASSSSSVPTLGSYHVNKVSVTNSLLPEQRRVTTGAFLDYGIWASFSPSFDHAGEIVGRRELGELLCRRDEKKRGREAEKRERIGATGVIVESKEMGQQPIYKSGKVQAVDFDAELEGLLPLDQVKSLKDALGSLDLENAVHELLNRNQRALRRLGELQRIRLSGANGGSDMVEEGSEEWDTAHAILDSLTILASLRPQSSKEGAGSIIPPPAVFRQLQRTLARRPSSGWYGTLPPTRATALRDDLTVKVHAGGTTSASTTSTPVSTTTTMATVPTTTPYAGYSYAYGQQPYRPSTTAGPYTPYKPSQYYQTSYLTATTQPLGPQSYYAQQAYSGGTSGQQPYAAYSAWYSQYSAPGSNINPTTASGTSSGRGTPQPTGPTSAILPTSYGNFFGTTGTPPPGVVRSPAVANTVLVNKPGTPGTTWTNNVYATTQQQSAVPALPTHARNGQGYTTQAGYYGAYTAQQAPATR
ncbi:hypothetical protein AX17_000491 [Amanita inopinata Kibby_2008]|nr:hypothetical protein AX17_000491 [Amanita inopinata Kibby_2008]